MALTDISHPTDIAMLTDLYELTMAQGLWESGKANEQGCFTAFYRDHPFGSAYAVMCGTAELPELVENLRFTPEDIDYLASLDACSSLLYCSDHGEDILDDARGRFLHASPTVTYYQIHVPGLVWFSNDYLHRYPERAVAAKSNEWAAATTHSMFHTIADLASITSDYVDESVSLVSGNFDKTAPRYYLNDHNEAVPYDAGIGLNAHDMEQFAAHGITMP